jgi:hypothetical protein
MSDALNLDDPRLGVNRVNNSIIADANAISALGARELFRAVWEWFVHE